MSRYVCGVKKEEEEEEEEKKHSTLCIATGIYPNRLALKAWGCPRYFIRALLGFIIDHRRSSSKIL
jgi:hypothetical protein